MNDTISRQAAIDALHTWFRDGFDEDRWWNSTHVLAAIEGLPSAQPEQRWIPCGKCIHADGKHRWCKVLDRTINEDYFCYWAEPFREEGETDEAD